MTLLSITNLSLADPPVRHPAMMSPVCRRCRKIVAVTGEKPLWQIHDALPPMQLLPKGTLARGHIMLGAKTC